MDEDEFLQQPFLTKEMVREAAETEDGQRLIFLYVMKERIPQGLALVFAHLGLKPPSAERQEEICKILWDTLFRVPAWEILETKELAIHMAESGLEGIRAEDLRKMRWKGSA